MQTSYACLCSNAGTEDATLETEVHRRDDASGEYCVTVTLHPVDDRLMEGTEVIIVQFTADSGVASVDCTLSIVDDNSMLLYDYHQLVYVSTVSEHN